MSEFRLVAMVLRWPHDAARAVRHGLAWCRMLPAMAAFHGSGGVVRLSARARQVWLLRQCHGLTHRAIAERLDIPAALVRWHLAHAMLGLAQGAGAVSAITSRGRFGVAVARQTDRTASVDDAGRLRQAAWWYAALTADGSSASDQQRWRVWLDQNFLHRRAWARIEAVVTQTPDARFDPGVGTNGAVPGPAQPR